MGSLPAFWYCMKTTFLFMVCETQCLDQLTLDFERCVRARTFLYRALRCCIYQRPLQLPPPPPNFYLSQKWTAWDLTSLEIFHMDGWFGDPLHLPLAMKCLHMLKGCAGGESYGWWETYGLLLWIQCSMNILLIAK